MTDTRIKMVRGRRVWDSRGNPTVEAEVRLACGALGRAIAPAGASRGSREAVDLRDGGARLGGLGVGRALAALAETLAPALEGVDACDQSAADAAIIACDPSPLKSAIGGNAAVAVSLAVLDAAAAARAVPVWQHVAGLWGAEPLLPLPEIQIFGGGAHAGRRVDVQDFMVMVPGAASFSEALEVTAEIYRAAGSIMAARGLSAGVAEEGGWWPMFDTSEAALETLMQAIAAAGETPGDRVVISLDIAASELGRAGRYRLAREDRALDSGQMIDLLGRWLDSYPIVAIEDPLGEDDPDGMAEFTRRFGSRVQVIGDDFLVSNAGLVTGAVAAGACNALLVKVNQAGTVSEAVAAHHAARRAGWRSIVSARSGETEDVAISHLATGLGAGQLKVGSFARSERMAKWNECLRIAEDLPATAWAAGRPLAGTWWGRRAGRSG